MKALVLKDVGNLEVQDIPIAKPVRDEVLIRVKVCGICGTDLHIFHGEEGAAKNPLPIVLGHEFSGVVEKVGAEVKDLKEGDRVAVDPNCTCGQCYYCRNGKPHFCTGMTCYGTMENGGFAELCLAKEKAVYKLPDSLDFYAGAMMEPVACCLHGVDLCQIQPGSTALVIGYGPIGQIMLQLVLIAGASRVAVIEPVAEKRKAALRFGACLALDPAEQDPADALREAGFDNIDTVIECVGKKRTMQQAVQLAGNTATVMLFGLTSPDEELVIKPFTDLFRKEIKLTASFINPLTCSRSLELLASGRLKVDGIITDKLPLEEAARAFTDNSFRSRVKIQVIP